MTQAPSCCLAAGLQLGVLTVLVPHAGTAGWACSGPVNRHWESLSVIVCYDRPGSADCLGHTCSQLLPLIEISKLCCPSLCCVQMQLPGPAQALYKLIRNPSVRLGAVAALALVAVWGVQASSNAHDADLRNMLEVRPCS